MKSLFRARIQIKAAADTYSQFQPKPEKTATTKEFFSASETFLPSSENCGVGKSKEREREPLVEFPLLTHFQLTNT